MHGGWFSVLPLHPSGQPRVVPHEGSEQLAPEEQFVREVTGVVSEFRHVRFPLAEYPNRYGHCEDGSLFPVLKIQS